jgi:hypothetical protein
MMPGELIELLAMDCLIDYASKDPWRLENIKPIPTLGRWAEEALGMTLEVNLKWSGAWKAVTDDLPQ